jgi:hypothetical protein
MHIDRWCVPMAKKRKKAKRIGLARITVPHSLVAAIIAAAQTPLGKLILAELLIQGGAMLAARRPTAAAAAVGAGAATAAKDVTGAAGSAAVQLLHGIADILKSSVGGHGAGKSDGRKRGSAAVEAGDGEANGGEARPLGNGSGGLWEALDSDLVRDAVIAEISRRKKNRKAKRIKR